MTALEKIKGFIAEFPGYDILRTFTVDYTDKMPLNGGIFPGGLVEVSRTSDIFNNVRVSNQYNFALYTVFRKAPGDDSGATVNAWWLMDFQEWVQEQSARGYAPAFGDEPEDERIIAQNGELYSDDEEGTAIYTVQITVNFTKIF